MLPGWGQISKGQKIKGWIFAGSTATSLLLSYIFDKRADDKYYEYKAATTFYQAAALNKDVRDLTDKVDLLSYITLGIWIYNIGDAYWSEPEDLVLGKIKKSKIKLTSSDKQELKIALVRNW